MQPVVNACSRLMNYSWAYNYGSALDTMLISICVLFPAPWNAEQDQAEVDHRLHHYASVQQDHRWNWVGNFPWFHFSCTAPHWCCLKSMKSWHFSFQGSRNSVLWAVVLWSLLSDQQLRNCSSEAWLLVSSLCLFISKLWALNLIISAFSSNSYFLWSSIVRTPMVHCIDRSQCIFIALFWLKS